MARGVSDIQYLVESRAQPLHKPGYPTVFKWRYAPYFGGLEGPFWVDQ